MYSSSVRLAIGHSAEHLLAIIRFLSIALRKSSEAWRIWRRAFRDRRAALTPLRAHLQFVSKLSPKRSSATQCLNDRSLRWALRVGNQTNRGLEHSTILALKSLIFNWTIFSAEYWLCLLESYGRSSNFLNKGVSASSRGLLSQQCWRQSIGHHTKRSCLKCYQSGIEIQIVDRLSEAHSMCRSWTLRNPIDILLSSARLANAPEPFDPGVSRPIRRSVFYPVSWPC